MDITEEFKNRDSFLHWFLISSLTGVKITEETTQKPRVLTMFLNGTELNSLNAINRLEEEFNRILKEKSKSIAKNKLEDILVPFEEKVQELTDTLQKMIDSLP